MIHIPNLEKLLVRCLNSYGNKYFKKWEYNIILV